jgi:hypothetical protein
MNYLYLPLGEIYATEVLGKIGWVKKNNIWDREAALTWRRRRLQEHLNIVVVANEPKTH